MYFNKICINFDSRPMSYSRLFYMAENVVNRPSYNYLNHSIGLYSSRLGRIAELSAAVNLAYENMPLF